ncbi:MAG: hypothetical protein NTZ10_06040 [Candidatus Saganbacteria bacterium]|nr:hypothetical protein [Candidatus Saganbacteria bacterium]
MVPSTRLTVKIDPDYRSITRIGLLANRFIHPLVHRSFGREIGMLAQNNDVTIRASQTGITAQTQLSETTVCLPLYSKLLGKAGVNEMEIPKGTPPEQIASLFRIATTRTIDTTFRLINQMQAQNDLHKIKSPDKLTQAPESIGTKILDCLCGVSYIAYIALPHLLNIAMVGTSYYFFGRDQYKFGAHFGSFFSTSNPFFIFCAIPQSRWIGAKILLSTALMADRFARYDDSAKHIVGFAIVNSLADIFILSATNDWTPDELKWQLPAIFLASNAISILIGRKIAGWIS